MIKFTRLVMALSLSGTLFSAAADTTGWQDRLSATVNALEQRPQSDSGSTRESAAPNGTSLAALAGLLSGGSQSLSAHTMTNAAGILQYCIKNNLVDNNVSSLKEQLFSKLGLEDTQKQQQSTDFQQGLMGLLNTGNNQQVNLKALGETPLGKKVKTRACDFVLKQGWKFIA